MTIEYGLPNAERTEITEWRELLPIGTKRSQKWFYLPSGLPVPNPQAEHKPEAKKPASPFMKSGETELTGLRCACGGSMLAEALCGSRAAKEKCLRIAICLECNNEVRIR